MMRTFIALPLPAGIRENLALLQQMLPLKSRVPPENMHLTLAFLGEQPDEVLEAVHDGLAQIHLPAPTVAVEGLGTFGGERPRLVFARVLPDAALTRLQARIARIGEEAGIARDRRRFLPHVTLSRDRPRGPDLMRLEQAIAQLDGFRAGSARIDEVVLYRSARGKGVPTYVPLARYPLHADGAPG